MKLVLQPKSSKICGHCCVSMISGKSIKTIIKLIGHEKGTTTKELVDALKGLKIKSGKRLKVIKDYSELPEKAIVKLKRKGKSNWHWVVIYHGLIHDPVVGRYTPDELHTTAKYSPNVNISSYLEIFS